MRTYYEEYEQIKDKAVVFSDYLWRTKTKEERNAISTEKTVIVSVGGGYAHKTYRVISNVNKLSTLECAIMADGGNLCFGYDMRGGLIAVHTD